MNVNAIEKIDFRKLKSEKYEFHWFTAMQKQDQLCIGTKYYQGLAYFWSMEYKHYLRDANNVQRKRVHKLFLKNNLDMTGSTEKHDAIIEKVFGIPIRISSPVGIQKLLFMPSR